MGETENRAFPKTPYLAALQGAPQNGTRFPASAPLITAKTGSYCPKIFAIVPNADFRTRYCPNRDNNLLSRGIGQDFPSGTLTG